jgi:hypothetical protein
MQQLRPAELSSMQQALQQRPGCCLPDQSCPDPWGRGPAQFSQSLEMSRSRQARSSGLTQPCRCHRRSQWHRWRTHSHRLLGRQSHVKRHQSSHPASPPQQAAPEVPSLPSSKRPGSWGAFCQYSPPGARLESAPGLSWQCLASTGRRGSHDIMRCLKRLVCCSCARLRMRCGRQSFARNTHSPPCIHGHGSGSSSIQWLCPRPPAHRGGTI